VQTGGGDHDDCDDGGDDCPVQVQTGGGDHDDCDEDDDCPVQALGDGGHEDSDDCDDDDCPVELQGDRGHDDSDGKDDCDQETTTTTTNPGEPTTTVAGVTETTLDIAAAGAECRRDIPYFVYDIDWAGGGTATITFLNPTGADVVYENMPLSGAVLWPGASENPPDWPGWILQDGVWVEADDGFLWARGTMQVQFEVNPTAVIQVSYPPASVACAGPENIPDTVGGVVITPPPPPTDEVGGVTVLPFTGVDTAPLAAMAFGAVALGTLLVVASRRDDTEET
jgi:hypothetical protein